MWLFQTSAEDMSLNINLFLFINAVLNKFNVDAPVTCNSSLGLCDDSDKNHLLLYSEI